MTITIAEAADIPNDIRAGTWKSRHFWWIARDGDNVAGYSAASVFDRDTLFFGPTLVLPEYRGRGLQREFTRVKEEFAVNHGFRRLVSSTDADNRVSANNLIACGFAVVEPWAPEPGLYFERSIGPNYLQ